MSFKPMIKTINDPNFYPNNLAFATPEEAEFSAKDTYGRWGLATEWRVDESDQPVNYHIDLETGEVTAVEVSDALTS